jgi:DNA polymerase V
MIDNKSFYASVEAARRGMDPLAAVLVVMSEQANTNGGLILATSPEAKRRYGLKANVSRQRDLPDDPELCVVPPRMNLYIDYNLKINALFQRFVAPEDLWPYSIDESLLDLTASWHLFGADPLAVARRIQATIHDELGLRVTIGIGKNPLQAKLALDLKAKRNATLIGRLDYDTIQRDVWPISDLTSIWSIAERTAAHLNRLGLYTIDDIAHTNPYLLKAEFGLAGEQLFALAWGVDRSHLADRNRIQSPSISNSQVLPRDYRDQAEIELVIKEIGAQVASRLRHHHYQTQRVSLGVGFAYADSTDGHSGFHQALTIPATNNDHDLQTALIRLFRAQWHGETIRNLAVGTGRLCPDSGQQLDLLTPLASQVHRHDLDFVLDLIRSRFGFRSLLYASSKLTGGTAIQRASLVGGHNGGNSYA